MKQESKYMTRREAAITVGMGALGASAPAFVTGIASLANPRHERASGRFEMFPVRKNGVVLDFVGVEHHLGTFIHNKERIRDQIRAARFVVPEAFNSILCPMVTRKTSDEEIRQLPLETQRFFASIAKMCAEEGKDIVVMNPMTLGSTLMYGLLLFGIPISTFLAVLAAKEKGNLKIWQAFLALVAQIPSLVTIFGDAQVSSLTQSDIEFLREVARSEKEFTKQKTLITPNNWRDVVTGVGFTKAQELWSGAEPILSYHGFEHLRCVDYIGRLDLTDPKLKLYLPYNISGHMRMERYHYDSTQEQWAMISSTPLS